MDELYKKLNSDANKVPRLILLEESKEKGFYRFKKGNNIIAWRTLVIPQFIDIYYPKQKRSTTKRCRELHSPCSKAKQIHQLNDSMILLHNEVI